jgi:hypothetical protein
MPCSWFSPDERAAHDVELSGDAYWCPHRDNRWGVCSPFPWSLLALPLTHYFD